MSITPIKLRECKRDLKLTLLEGKPVLQINGKAIGLDCHHGDYSFISHAHSDHSSFGRRAKRVVTTPETLSLMRARNAYTAFETAELAELPGVRLLSSGHVLGGVQLHATEDRRSFLYTGDFKCSPSLTAGEAQAEHATELLMECTYGSPEYKFPPREDVYRQMAQWSKSAVEAGEITVIGAYALGKAQEVVAALNKYAGIVPRVSGETYDVCRAYARHGVPLDFVSMDEAKQHTANEAFAAVVPMNIACGDLCTRLSGYYGMKAHAAVATGWSGTRMYAGVENAFPLSDHEDFNGLVSFVKKISPEKVYCTHGFAESFASHLKSIGFDAVALEDAFKSKQTVLETNR